MDRFVEHFVTKTGIRTVHRSAWVTAPDTGTRANIGEWLRTKARRKNYLPPAERGRLAAAFDDGHPAPGRPDARRDSTESGPGTLG
ncbi:hypothetical protein R3Q06_33395 [Rhodococcus erythropolis]|uniref:hypothetical protein n=1 Tax=Rhodococcus erythropolis TaxID=1833 RepID=UPI00294A2C96|nr:hypothetical protein [Rhodococcus erythropolis]MDV6278336.1 hypothetical protein [Rhodococcus erythropolis]